jgi:hypothetical protein
MEGRTKRGSRFEEEQIIAVLREHEAGCRGGRSGTGQLEVSLRGRLEPGVGSSRIDERLGESSAVSGAQPDRLRFLDRAPGRRMRAGD